MSRANQCRRVTASIAAGSADPSSTTITSSTSDTVWTASAVRHLLKDAGRSRVGTTTDTSGADEALRDSFDGTGVSRTELEQRLHELALFQIIGFGVDAPDIVGRTV